MFLYFLISFVKLSIFLIVKIVLKSKVNTMMTKNQLRNYLRLKDKKYVNKLIELLYEQDDEDIDSSYL